ncbi:unnamed protein product, partial [Musa textilis]
NLHCFFHFLGHGFDTGLWESGEAVFRPTTNRIAVERPLELAPALPVRRRQKHLERRDVPLQPYVVVGHFVLEAPPRRVESQQLLVGPDGRLAVVAGRAGAVANAAGLAFGAGYLPACFHQSWEPQVKATEAGEEGPGFLSLGGWELGRGFAFPLFHG